jgi:hypothetical protein
MGCFTLYEDKTCSSVPAATLNDGQLDAALDNARADGVAGKASGVVDIELGHETLAMLLNRLHADAEFHRDLFVGFCEKSDSKRRQLDECEEFCQENGLVLETSRRFYDEGRSAYKGKHLTPTLRTQGACGP